MSHPTWVRELKLLLRMYHRIESMSHPTWVRELKRSVASTLSPYYVAPYVGA